MIYARSASQIAAPSVTRLITSLILGLIFWLMSASLLVTILLPCPATGCDDDLGAGLVAVVIGIGTAAFSLMGVVIFNMMAGVRRRRVRR